MFEIFKSLSLAVLLVAGVFLMWGIAWYFDEGYKKVKKWLRKRRLLKNAVFTISEAVWNYAEKNDPALISKWGGGSNKPSYERFRVNMRVKVGILPEINKWQDFFDQVLKMRAENLQKIYDQECECEKGAVKNVANNSMSRYRIDVQISSEESIAKGKKYIEREFWELHNTLQYLGLKTWDSYKAYLKLKPMKASKTLDFLK